MISVSNLARSFGDNLFFEKASFQLNPGDPTSFGFVTINVEESDALGLEADVRWLPGDNWMLYATLGLLDTEEVRRLADHVDTGRPEGHGRTAIVAGDDTTPEPRTVLTVVGGRVGGTGRPDAAGSAGLDLELPGHVILPGLINAHDHLYATLIGGMPLPDRPLETFTDILTEVWWPLDRALDGK